MRADHQHQRVLVVPGHAEQAALDRLLLAVDGGDGERLAAVSGAVLGVAGRRLAFAVDEQAVETARLGQRLQRGIAGPVEKGAVGVEQRVEAIDQDAHRQAIENRPPFAGVAGGIAIARGPRRRAGRHGGRGRLAADIVGHRRGLAFSGWFLQTIAELAREFLEGAVLARAERRRRLGLRRDERQHIIREFLRSDVVFRRGNLRAALLQRGQAIDVAADAEAAVAGELAVMVEHRQARHLDRQGRIRIVDRPGHDDAAPGGARGQRARHVTLRIELEGGGDFRPRPIEHGGGLRPDQPGEFVGAEREAGCGIHLPDEAERKAARLRFRRGGIGRDRRRLGSGGRRGRAGARGLGGRAEGDEQRDGRAGAQPQHGGGPSRDVAVGSAVEHRLAGELVGAERDQVAFVGEALARRRHGLDQFAVGAEDRRRPLEIGEQPLRAVRQAEVFAGALGRDHQHGGTVVGQRDARAKTDQRAAEAGAESAQALQARRGARRQRAGQARDLPGGEMRRLKADSGQRAGREAIEDRGGGRIGPQHAGGVRAPKPYRRRAQGMGREPRIAQAGELKPGPTHRTRRTVYG